MTPALSSLLGEVRGAVTVRSDALFTEFLPKGYAATTLSSVPVALRDPVILTKVRIGTLITLYDDLADRPALRNPEVLEQLYRLPFSYPVAGAFHPIVRLATRLWEDVFAVLRRLPQYQRFRKLFDFDVGQFYSANRYSELITDQPELANQRENRAYGPHNMGLLIVATVDLMASSGVRAHELGMIRSFLHDSQVAARIMNVITTHDRERQEGDVTGEIATAMIEQPLATEAGLTESLVQEQEALLRSLESQAPRIESFDAHRYLLGLRELHRLHERMKGEI